jgi:CubicO group peptidase (beta-lactamase class C family)
MTMIAMMGERKSRVIRFASSVSSISPGMRRGESSRGCPATGSERTVSLAPTFIIGASMDLERLIFITFFSGIACAIKAVVGVHRKMPESGGWIGGMRKARVSRGGVLVLLLAASPVLAAADVPQITPVQAAAVRIRHMLEQVQRVPGSFPAVAAVVVEGDTTPLLYVNGLAHAGTGVRADHATLFYVASQTKSFMGLLAAQLDTEGVLPLDTTLAQVWPKLRLPAPADPAAITLADLLSHQEPLTTKTLNHLTAYVRAVPAVDYPDLLARYTEARKPGFRYSNLGDLIYGAALEVRTGRRWQDWLRADVLQPLGLADAHAATSGVAPRRLAWNHQWDGSRWHALPPKPDALMHAAGGLALSSDGMAIWMRANLTRRSPAGMPTTAAFERAQHPIVHADLADDEIDCNGYSLGWYTCVYKGERVLMHPGSYPGVVSVTVLLPARNAGLSLAINSDSAIEGLELETLKAFIGLSTGKSGEDARLAKIVADYPLRLAKRVKRRADAIAAVQADAKWAGFDWRPSRLELDAYAGVFESPRLGALRVERDGDALVAILGAQHERLQPATPGLFAAWPQTLDPPGAFRYDAARDAIDWDGDRFVRKASSRGVALPQSVARSIR